MLEVLTILPSVGLDLAFFDFPQVKSNAAPSIVPFHFPFPSTQRRGWMDADSVTSAILIVLISAELGAVSIRRHGYGCRVDVGVIEGS